MNQHPRQFRSLGRTLLALTAVAAFGCSVPVASSLEESDANHAVVALADRGISASRERDPESEGHFRVLVQRDDAASAARFLTEDNLPPRPTPGVLDAVSQGSMVPSRLAERARLVAGTSGDLERSLLGLDGVLSARVHLAIPEADPLASDDEPEQTTASVLVRHRGATPPITLGDVQRLVAGAVPGLAADHVSVVMTQARVAPDRAESKLSQFGPIAVTRSSITPLRVMVGVIVLVNAALFAALVVLWGRLRRTEVALVEAKATPEPTRART